MPFPPLLNIHTIFFFLSLLLDSLWQIFITSPTFFFFFNNTLENIFTRPPNPPFPLTTQKIFLHYFYTRKIFYTLFWKYMKDFFLIRKIIFFCNSTIQRQKKKYLHAIFCHKVIKKVINFQFDLSKEIEQLLLNVLVTLILTRCSIFLALCQAKSLVKSVCTNQKVF